MNSEKMLSKINLQLFNGLFPEGHEGSNPLLVDNTPATAPTEPTNTDGGSDAPDVPPVVEQPSQDKFDVSSLIEGVKEAIAQGNQSVIDGFQKMNSPEPQGEVDNGPSQEELEAQFNNEWREKLFENPYAFMQELQKAADEKAQAKIQPFLDERENSMKQATIEQEVADFISQHDDFHDHAERIVEFFTKYPNMRDVEGVTEIAYNYAKGLQYEAPPTLDEILNREGSVEHLSANDKIKELVLQNYFKSLKEGQPPASFGGKGGSPSPTPVTRPTSIKEASEQLRASFAAKGY